MHWFWRAVVAVALGTIGTSCCRFVHSHIGAFAVRNISRSIGAPVLFDVYCVTVPYIPCVLAVCIYAVLLRRFNAKAYERETRCRRCSYNLRGIPEPRCPECGEHI